MTTFTLNGEKVTFEEERDTPLLWVLRDHFRLYGTKFGCGIGACGACTVHLDGTATRSCVLPVSAVEGAAITTIEGLSAAGDHPVQLAWLEHDVPQCGYCQAGQIMAASAFLERVPNPTDAQIDEQMTNLCRCGTYVRVRAAVHRAAKLKRGEDA